MEMDYGLVFFFVVALICLFWNKEHTYCLSCKYTFPLVDAFRRMSVKTGLLCVTPSVIKIETKRFCQSLLKGWLSVWSPSDAAREDGLLLSLVASFSFLCRIILETACFVLWNIDLQRPIDCNVLSLSCSFPFMTARTTGLGTQSMTSGEWLLSSELFQMSSHHLSSCV